MSYVTSRPLSKRCLFLVGHRQCYLARREQSVMLCCPIEMYKCACAANVLVNNLNIHIHMCTYWYVHVYQCFIQQYVYACRATRSSNALQRRCYFACCVCPAPCRTVCVRMHFTLVLSITPCIHRQQQHQQHHWHMAQATWFLAFMTSSWTLLVRKAGIFEAMAHAQA